MGFRTLSSLFSIVAYNDACEITTSHENRYIIDYLHGLVMRPDDACYHECCRVKLYYYNVMYTSKYNEQ